ncbi:MAG TPA: MarR family transcriptional regulator [Tissierellia bacterium]|nr:MarR family transcriptional regulator [Tissierellia bacterium]
MKYSQKDQNNLRMLIGLSRNTTLLHRRGARIFRKSGLSLMQFAVLEALYHKGPMSIKEILESLLATGGNVTLVIKNLQKLGLVDSLADPEDRRVRIVSITKRGEEKIEEIFPKHLLDLEEYFEVLSDEEKERLIALLKKLGRVKEKKE